MNSVVGVIPLYDEERDSYWMLPGYMQGLEEQGLLPVMLPLTDSEKELEGLNRLCGGYLFTGGHDVDPLMYGEERKPVCGAACEKRDKMEKYLFSLALKEDKPVLGICRGIQLINVLCGGSLYQDLPEERPGNTEHHQVPPYDEPVHRVELNSPLAELVGRGELWVNSYHHQAIKELGKGLRAMAYSEDGLTEGIYMPDKRYVWAVQWHPEFAYKTDKAARLIFKSFAEAVKEEAY